MAQCTFCKGNIELTSVYRETICPHCSKDVKVCLNCQFYEPGAHWDCRENISEPVYDKERRNFCDYFRLNKKVGNQTGEDPSGDAKDKFNALFGD